MKTLAISFSNTDSLFDANKITEDIKSLNMFDEVKPYSELDFSDDYLALYGDRFKKLNRGYGYWSWKPYIIKDAISKLDFGDILLYVDAGYEVNPKHKKVMETWLKLAQISETGILCLSGLNFMELQWSKMDLVSYVAQKYNKSISFFLSERPYQHGAGILMFRKAENSIRFIDEWFDLCNNHYDLITDKKSVIDNIKGFKENRHDQSAYSLLLKVFGGDNIANNIATEMPYSTIRPMHKGHDETYEKYKKINGNIRVE